MKKAIKILSVIALISTVIFTLFSIIMGFYYTVAYGKYVSDSTQKAWILIVIRIAIIVILAAFDIFIAVYLINSKNKSYSAGPEIVLTAVRFAAVPIISSVVSVVTLAYQNTLSISDIQLYSYFNNGTANLFTNFDFSTPLLLIALSFAIADKVLAKKRAEAFAQITNN